MSEVRQRNQSNNAEPNKENGENESPEKSYFVEFFGDMFQQFEVVTAKYTLQV